MTTAPATLIDIQNRLTKNLHTVNLGIVGDDRHKETGGYHIGAATLRAAGMSGDYSLQYALDRAATHDFACAFDIGGTPAQLMEIGDRIVHALMTKDPRVYRRIRAVNSPFDNVTIDRRYDIEDPNNTSDDNCQASEDRGHIHIEVYRSLVLSQGVIDDLYAVLSGAPAQGDDEMTPAQMQELKDYIKGLQQASDAGLTRRLDKVITPLLEKIDAAVEPQTPSKGA
jgi:hypothetical protein